MGILGWGVSVGLAGLALGVLVPVVLDPTSGNGPLLGFFITGPGGFVVGMLIGAIKSHMRMMDAPPGAPAPGTGGGKQPAGPARAPDEPR